MSDDTPHQGLPMAGYTPQPQSAVDLVNTNKQAEERILRLLDDLAARTEPDGAFVADKRWLAIARTHIEQGFMAANRAVFKPARAKLPEDDPPAAA